MDNVATASINNLRIPEADVPPSEDPIFVLTASQLRQIVTEAVQKAIQPLQDRISSLEDRTASLEKENAALCSKLASLESLQESEICRVCVDIAQDRRRLAALEQRPLTGAAPSRGEKSIARISKIDEVLKNRGPTTLKQLEHILGVSPKEMNRLIGRLDKRRYEVHSRPGDAREKVLRLKVQIV